MTAFTFTADTNDQLEITGHGLLTGDGPAVVWNEGGALPAATPSLALDTDYWIIRVDDDHIKLATSQANAIAGTAIDITDVGTGTHRLGIGLPFRRASTYTALSQVKSADLNAIQDEIEREWWSDRTEPVPINPDAATNWAASVLFGDPPDAMILGSSDAGQAAWTLRVPVGRRLVSVDWILKGNGSTDLTASIYRQHDDNDTPTLEKQVAFTNPGASFAAAAIDAIDVMADDASELILVLEASASGLTVKNITMTHEPEV